ncbi:MAG: hypothetical protein WC510_05970 [Candidatus Omnitrophota bacterium]
MCRRGLYSLLFFLVSLCGLISVSAQPALSPSQASELKEPEPQWLWGEVVSVDAASGELTVKYVDYETDSEKELTIHADSKTAYINVKSLLEIKPQDTLSIDYAVSSDGRNIAINVVLEKMEDTPEIQP